MDRLAQLTLSPSPESPLPPAPTTVCDHSRGGIAAGGRGGRVLYFILKPLGMLSGVGGGGQGPDALPGAVDRSDRRLPRPRNPPGAERAAPAGSGSSLRLQ